MVYFRLHGLGGDGTNYTYRYADADLSRLASIISNYAESKKVYVMFNNITMGDDALRLKSLMR